MEQNPEGTSTYRPRTGSMERRKTTSSAPKSTARAAVGEERIPARTARATAADDAPPAKRVPRQSFFKNRTPQPEMREEEKPRAERRSSVREERGAKPFARKPYGEKSFGDKPRRTFGEDKPQRSVRPFEKKPYGSVDKKPFERKPRKDIRVLERKPKALAKPKMVAKDPNAPVRLNKFIANSGVCSRREADEYIESGQITVNGEVVTVLGTKVLPTDDIRWNGERLSGEKKVYVLLNKPKGYVTTMDDPHADKTVMDLIAGACRERVYPVGRLDKNTTGVLLFTNDGELTKQLTHPSYNKRKIYQATLNKTLKKGDMEQLVKGIELEDGVAIADEAGYPDLEDKTVVGLEIHSGRNRVVRRMFEALGYEVKKLDRVYFAGLTKKSLERGKWRVLAPKEVNMLKMGAYQ